MTDRLQEIRERWDEKKRFPCRFCDNTFCRTHSGHSKSIEQHDYKQRVRETFKELSSIPSPWDNPEIMRAFQLLIGHHNLDEMTNCDWQSIDTKMYLITHILHERLKDPEKERQRTAEIDAKIRERQHKNKQHRLSGRPYYSEVFGAGADDWQSDVDSAYNTHFPS